jgi:hypothetical protein
MKNRILKIAAIAIALFALLTVFMSSSVLFDWFGIRAKEGNYVGFVVGTNFICGFLYLLAAYGLFTRKRWTTRLLVVALVLLAGSFIGLMWHIDAGGLYEMRTVKAMLFRLSVTLAFAGISWRLISNDPTPIERISQ